MNRIVIALSLALALAGCAEKSPSAAAGPKESTAVNTPKQPVSSSVSAPAPAASPAPTGKVVRSEAEWKKMLTPEQYEVLRQKGTERAFSGKYWDTKTPGVYKCAACGAVLFSSDAKFDSGCGWPSFDRMIAAGTIEEHQDTSHDMVRTEVTCARCGGHLGHVFDDGPTSTHLRYCINSASIELDPKSSEAKKDEPPAGGKKP